MTAAAGERTALLDDHIPVAQASHAPVAKTGRLTKAVGTVVALFGVFLANADDSFVMATYESIASEFLRLADGPWLLTAYTLGYCIALPMYARASDLAQSRKIPLLAAYLLFSLGCLISGLGDTLGQVIIGRVIAGIGGSGMIAMISVIITDFATLEQVAVLRSYVNVAAIAGRSFGSPAGGYLADTVGWRWSFLVQTPIGVICMLLIAWHLPSRTFSTSTTTAYTASAAINASAASNTGSTTTKPAPHYISPDTGGNSSSDNSSSSSSSSSSRRAKLRHVLRDVDVLGAGLFAAATASFLFVMNEGGQKRAWRDPATLGLGFACLALVAAFLLAEAFVARRPLIPLRLLRTNGVGLFCALQVLLFGARLATLSNIAPYFIRSQGASNAVAAKYVATSSIGNAVGALIAGHVISRTRKYKTLALGSAALGALAHGLIAVRWRRGIAAWWEAQYVVAAGMASGAAMATQFIGLSASAPRAQLATAVGVYYLSQQLGSIVGVSVAGAVARADFRGQLQRRLRGLGGEGKAIIDNALSDARFYLSLPSALQAIVRESYLHSFQLVPLLSLAGYLIASVILAVMAERSMAPSY